MIMGIDLYNVIITLVLEMKKVAFVFLQYATTIPPPGSCPVPS